MPQDDAPALKTTGDLLHHFLRQIASLADDGVRTMDDIRSITAKGGKPSDAHLRQLYTQLLTLQAYAGHTIFAETTLGRPDIFWSVYPNISESLPIEYFTTYNPHAPIPPRPTDA
jgi:hypothetical protein